MNHPAAPTHRILAKLSQAMASDPSREVFGADAHGYGVHAPATPQVVNEFEARLGIRLPPAYRQFVLEVGNGGGGYAGSAAGPFYGIYAVGDRMGEIPPESLAQVVARPCMLTPGMPLSDWQALVASVQAGGETDDDGFDGAQGTLFGGILPLGSQGCSSYHGLVVNGPLTGRVVNFDTELGAPPVFAFEADFLAWYERWLDEIIAGDLLQEGPPWFGYARGGAEAQLLAGWLGSEDAHTAQEYLAGLLYKARLSDATLDALAACEAGTEMHRVLVCQIVCKHDPGKARPLLTVLAAQDPLAFLQCLHWHARGQTPQWQAQVLSIADGITDVETFRFFTYVLEALPVDRGPILAPYTRHGQAGIRRQALYALGKLADRKPHLPCFIAGLHDEDGSVVHAALQALSGLKHCSLLAHYRLVAQRYPEERDHVLANLDHRLKELGTTRTALLQAPVGAGGGAGLGAVLGAAMRLCASLVTGRRNGR